MCLTVAVQVLLQKPLEALGSLHVAEYTAEVVIGGDVVLGVTHHIDDLTQNQ